MNVEMYHTVPDVEQRNDLDGSAGIRIMFNWALRVE